MAPISRKERGTDAGNFKLDKTRWEVMTGSRFLGPKYPLGALIFYRAKSDGMAEPTTKPGMFAGWKLESGLRYRDAVLVLDYDATRHRAHLHWQPKTVHVKEVYFPDEVHLEFPLANAAKNALKNMTDPEHESKQCAYDRSLVSGVLPYEVEMQFEEAIKKHMNAVPIEEYPSMFLFLEFGGLCLCIYVDDFILAGREEHHGPFWKKLGEHIMIDDIGDLGRFLGRHHCTIEYEGQSMFAFDMREYARTIISDYTAITGVRSKPALSPFLSIGYTDEPQLGSLAGRASSILMKLMWLARLARPDLLKSTCFLARKVNSWSHEEDLLLSRAIGYLIQSADQLLTGSLSMKPEELFVEAYCDADFAGEVDDMYSTSGGWIQLTDESGRFFPLAWLSKKQTAVSRSTTEAEVVALSYVLFEEAIDLAELYSQVLGRRVMLKLREDSEACAKVVSTGYSRKLRHLKRTHKVNIAAVKEQLDRDDSQLELVNTTRQKADVFTKALQTAKWPAAMSLMGLTMSQYRILTSINTGLKQSADAAAEALQPDATEPNVQTPPPPPSARKGRKTRAQRAQRIPLYNRDPEGA